MKSVPCSALEQLVAEVAEELLDVERLGLDDELGGAAGAVGERVGQRLGVAWPGTGEDRTVAGIAGRVSDAVRPRGRAEALAGLALFAEGMPEAEREIRLRDGACGTPWARVG